MSTFHPRTDFPQGLADAPWPEQHALLREPFVAFQLENVEGSTLYAFATASRDVGEAEWNGTEWRWITMRAKRRS